jgi:hypothetical protein
MNFGGVHISKISVKKSGAEEAAIGAESPRLSKVVGLGSRLGCPKRVNGGSYTCHLIHHASNRYLILITRMLPTGAAARSRSA